MGMDLRSLRNFVTAAEIGSETAAATALHITQPALSRQLRSLERELGLQLFERHGRGMRLTRPGEEFLPMARELLALADHTERAVKTLASGRLNELRLAVPTTTLTDVLAPFLATLRHDDPVAIVREMDPRGAAAALDAGADLVVVPRTPERRLASHLLAVLPIWAYVTLQDPWAEREAVTLAELTTRPLIVMTPDFRPRIELDAALDAASIAYGDVIECTNAHVAQALAASQRGVAVVSDDPKFGLIGLRIQSPHGPLSIKLHAAWKPDHHAGDQLQALAARLEEFCTSRYPGSTTHRVFDGEAQ